MAEVDARVARGAPAAPITATAIGKLSGLTAEPRLLAADGGLIDAFAEVFASMSRRWAAADSNSGQNFGDDSSGRESLAHRQAKTRDGLDSNLGESFDAARDQRAANQRPGQDDAKNADDWSLLDVASSAAGQLGATNRAADGIQQAESDQERSQTVKNQSHSAQVAQGDEGAQGDETLGLDQRRQQDAMANRTLASDRNAASMEGDEQPGDPRATARNAVGDSRDQAALQTGSNIAEQLANRRRRHRTQPINDPNPADAKSSNRGPLGALKLASGGIPVAAEAVELASQGMASSPISPTTIPAVPPMAKINQVQALAPTSSVSDSVPGARTAAKGWSPSIDLNPAPSQGESQSASGNAHAAKSSSDVVARIKLIQRVSKAFQHLGPDGGSVRIRLAPAELGSVRVEMQVHDRRVKARVVAETESASTALREHLSDLRARLESYGMQVERLEVEVEMADRGFDPRQDANSQWQSPQQQRGSGNRVTTDTPASTRTESDLSARAADTMANIVGAANRGVDVRL